LLTGLAKEVARRLGISVNVGMGKPPRYRLSEAEKNALVLEHAALIERLAARVAELEALVGKPQKTSANSHIPPSQDGPGRCWATTGPRSGSRTAMPGSRSWAGPIRSAWRTS
jgi:hypothetical protein